MFWEDLVRRWRRSRLPWLVVTVLAIIGALALLLIAVVRRRQLAPSFRDRGSGPGWIDMR